MLPTIKFAVSRKVVATFIVTGVAALLRTFGVYEAPADVTAWIAVGSGLAAGAIVGEGTKYVNYFLAKKKLPFQVDDKA